MVKNNHKLLLPRRIGLKIIKRGLTQKEHDVMWVVIDLLYGYNRIKAEMASNYIAQILKGKLDTKQLKIESIMVRRALMNLQKKHCIHMIRTGVKTPNIISLHTELSDDTNFRVPSKQTPVFAKETVEFVKETPVFANGNSSVSSKETPEFDNANSSVTHDIRHKEKQNIAITKLADANLITIEDVNKAKAKYKEALGNYAPSDIIGQFKLDYDNLLCEYEIQEEDKDPE